MPQVGRAGTQIRRVETHQIILAETRLRLSLVGFEVRVGEVESWLEYLGSRVESLEWLVPAPQVGSSG